MNEKATFLCDMSGETLIVYVRGEIDHHTAVSVRNGIDAILFERRPHRLMIDLSGVGFMDSSGLGLIMGRLSVMKSLEGEVVLRDPGRDTLAILSLAGIERLIPIEYTRAELMPVQPRKKVYKRPKVAVRKDSSESRNERGRQRHAKSPTTSA